MRTRKCDDATMSGRMRKAQQFMEAADTIRELADDEADVGDAFVTMCVHAGIAAADVLCCVSLGEHAQGDDHTDAVALVKRVHPDGAEMSKALNVLLGLKTKAGYSSRPVSTEDRKRAHRSAERLVNAARDRSTTGT